MDKLEAILKVLRSKRKMDDIDTPEGFCPNCWGRQEYGNKFYQAALNRKVDINNLEPQLGWIQGYAEKHLYKTRLKAHDEDNLVCGNCKLTYRQT